MALVTERSTLALLLENLKTSLLDFPRHRFNNFHTKEVFNSIKNSLKSEQISKIQDFSENYTCLVPEEVQSLHWTQTQVTIFPVVVFRRDDTNNLTEEHLVFISADLHHECAFVEYVNMKIHQYYESIGVKINHDIEFNDGCSAQFKSFWLFAKRQIRWSRGA